MTVWPDHGEQGAGCLCGAVRMRVNGAPLRVGLCHCLDCRKAHGAPAVAFAMFDRGRVTIEAADGTIGGRRSPRGHLRAFCTACGSPLYGEAGRSREIELPLGLFDRPGLWSPSYEGWASRKEPWLTATTLRHSFPEDREPDAI